MSAIAHANSICDWQENLTEEDMPPQWMWPLDHEVVAWFDAVAERRKARFAGSGGDSGDDDSGLMMENEFAKGRR